MRKLVTWCAMFAVLGGALLGVLVSSATPAEAQLLPPPQVLLEVHPNERAQGQGGGPKLGTAPWTSSGLTGTWYEWKQYHFFGSDSLWIQVCAQNFNSAQNASGKDDMLQMKVDGIIPSDLWGIMTGWPGVCQWVGRNEHGNRYTLEFFVGPNDGLTVGKHVLKFSAKETPIIWWIKVYDMNQRYPD